MASTVWRGFVTFGLISIPVRLFRAARAERVSLRRLYRAGSAPKPDLPEMETQRRPSLVPRKSSEPGGSPRIGQGATVPLPFQAPQPEPVLERIRQAAVRKGTDEVLSSKEVVKGYEYEKGRFVVVEPEELKSIAPKTATEMEIQEFVQFAEIDPVYLETSYYVVPEQAGERAYALLYRALQQTGLVAIAQFAMHSREHVIILRPGHTGITGHTMYFSSEVRRDEEYRADTSVVTPKELELAQTLIHSLAAPFEPDKYRDSYREKLEAILASKVKGQPSAPTEKIHTPAEVVDITEALRKSLANLKKPAASAENPEKTAVVGASKPKKSPRTTRK